MKQVCSFTIVSCKRQLTGWCPQSVFQLLKYYSKWIQSNIQIHYFVLNVARLARSVEKLLEPERKYSVEQKLWTTQVTNWEKRYFPFKTQVDLSWKTSLFQIFN